MKSTLGKTLGLTIAALGLFFMVSAPAFGDEYMCRRKADRAYQQAYDNCMDGFNPDRCYRDSDCSWNEQCISGRCQYVDPNSNRCYRDSECAWNEQCISGRCRHVGGGSGSYSCGSCYREYGQYYQYDVYQGSSLVTTVRNAGTTKGTCESWYRAKDNRCGY